MTSYAENAPSVTTVPASNLALLTRAHLVKPVELEKRISFIVWLKLRNGQKLDEFIEDVYDQNSPKYQQFLSYEAYEQNFAPTKNTEEKIRQFFLKRGMQAKIVNHSVRVEGSVEQVQEALQLHMNYYQYQDSLVYANSSLPQLTPELAQYISGIVGLSTIPEYYPNISNAEPSEDTEVHDLNFIWNNNFAPSALPTDISLKGFTGTHLQTAYNINNISKINGVPLDGRGQTLVVVDKCGTNGPESILRDANQYFASNNIKPFITKGSDKNFAIVNSNGTPFTQCKNASSFSREIVLDVESSHTIAPGNNTVLVLGEQDQATILMDTISTLIHNKSNIAGFNNAYVISNSWGGPDHLDQALETQLQLATASGISVNFSSGDCGDDTYATSKKCTGYSSVPASNYPASSPYVTAVGATALFVDKNYQYAFETVWGTVKPENAQKTKYVYDGGTGGGVSKVYGPVSWQKSTIYSFTAGGYGPLSQFKYMRAVPDVAMLGDPHTGLLIVANGSTVQDGGTSLACPLFSATLVLVNQARSLLNKATPIGHAAPYLYKNNSVFLSNRALRLIVPPAAIISGATPPPDKEIQKTKAPASAFTIKDTTFGWDSALTVEPENQFWNDAVGVGSPDIPKFVMTMANM